MKKALLILLNLAFFTVFAQVPQAIKYQAVARNAGGNILFNQSISLRLSILSDSSFGPSMYSEVHHVATNAYGLVNLEIGRGTAVSGTFSGIDWSKGQFFVKMEVDENGGNTFSFLGVTQLLSVPFALYANSSGIPRMTDAQRDGIINPSEGTLIYNLSSECLNYRGSSKWLQVCGECVPLPSNPAAGPDSTVNTSGSIQLYANLPQYGTGSWRVDSGANGSFSNIHDPHSMFYGENNTSYVLTWQIATPCDTLEDQVSISFNYNISIPTLYILGDATSSGWDTTNPIQMFSWTPNKFDQYLNLTPDPKGFKFIMTSGTWAVNWGTSMTSAINLNQEYDMVLHGNKIMLPDSGKYHVEVNFLTNKFKVTTFYAPDSLYLVGGSTPAGWNPSQAIPFNQISMGVFQVYVPMTAGVNGFKFLPHFGTWADDWGQDPASPANIIQNGEQDCPVNQNGFYLITVDFRGMMYTATPVSWGMIGSASPGGWNTDVDMTYLGGTQPYTFEIANIALTSGVLKFRANDSWELNLGDNNTDGSLELYGADIPVNPGSYQVKLVLAPGNWHYLLNPNIAVPCGTLTVPWGGMTYHTVTIGSQCWLKENLNIGNMINWENNQSDNSVIEKYCYNNDSLNCNIYGGLYQWNEMMQYSSSGQSICPPGFHVPGLYSDWTLLANFLGGTSSAGGYLKEVGLNHWNTPNTGAIDQYGFTALPGGYSLLVYGFVAWHLSGYFWSSTEATATTARHATMTSSSSAMNLTLGTNLNQKTHGMSVRCLKD